jgi:hypothetical protein
LDVEGFFTKRFAPGFCQTCKERAAAQLIVRTGRSLLFVSFYLDPQDFQTREKALELLQKYKTISFPNESRTTPLVYFELCFLTIHIKYPQPIQGVHGHEVGLVLNNKGLGQEIYYYDSLKNGGKMMKMDSLRPPTYLKNWRVGTALYRRL